MVNFDHADSALKQPQITCMVGNPKFPTPKHVDSDTGACVYLSQVPPSEARFASGASQPRSPGPQKRGTWYKLASADTPTATTPSQLDSPSSRPSGHAPYIEDSDQLETAGAGFTAYITKVEHL
ncbi:hypothetical protein PGT21_018491 [Puccinia graminis f. sp. tritici]|uniref:Uncharacterized protein n=1 Tax=Puccinia graminis f. sp. tritici TaxID=56615 RepID=A0A5B0PJN6_PUCGR|nr:hypothetical protein PGT21_018491 [Puccinia graminis f. sp. tritici]